MKQRENPLKQNTPSVDWVQILAQAMIGATLLLLLTVSARAAVPNLSDPAERERALQRHREQVAELLEQRRQERAERQANPVTEDEEMGLDPHKRTAITGASESSLRVPSAAQLLCQPLNVTTHIGENFLTDVQLKNLSGGEITSVQVTLNYDPHMLNPIQISDHQIHERLSGPARLTGDPRAGVLSYIASFEVPHTGISQNILTVEWEPLLPSPMTRIQIASESDLPSRVMSGRANVLGGQTDESDGVISTDVSIRPKGNSTSRDTVLLDSRESLQRVFGVMVRGGVELSLVTEPGPIEVGDVVALDIMLNNEMGNPIDDVRLAVEWDPEVFEVLDAAPTETQRPEENWIVGGVNIYDAPFRVDYPFDFHIRNDANRQLGRATYQMGMSEARILQSGTLGRLYLRALEPADGTEVHFLESLDTPTAIRCLGVDLLGDEETEITGLNNLNLRVHPQRVSSAN